MRTIIFDRYARETVRRQRGAMASDSDTPLRWHGLVDSLNRRFLGRGADDGVLWDVLRNRARMFCWHPSVEALTAAAAPGGLVYLCWGMPGRRLGGLVSVLFDRMLRSAEHILVNDAKTLAEIEEACGRRASLVPFYVDSGYFGFRPLEERGRFLFCNGSNDRDVQVLVALAERGFPVVWLANDKAVQAAYSGRHPNLKLVSRLSFGELRTLYQTCAAQIMPTTQDAHCAGQTTSMEAIACGAPVVISGGRTAGILEGIPSVRVIAADTVQAWVAEVSAVLDGAVRQHDVITARSIIERRTSIGNIVETLSPFMGWSGDADPAEPRRAS